MTDFSTVAQHAPRHLGLVVVLDFDVQNEVAVFTLHVGNEVGSTVFNALVFCVDDLSTVDLEVQQNTRDVDGNPFEDVFGDDVFFGHWLCDSYFATP